MNIGFFTDTYFPQLNGVSYTIKLWKDELERKGHNVYVYYPKSRGYSAGKNEIALPSVRLLAVYKDYRISIPMHVDEKLDLVHLHGFFTTALLGLKTARNLKIPRVMTYHTPLEYYVQLVTKSESAQKVLKKLYGVYESELFEYCDLVTVPSPSIGRMLEGKGAKDVKVLSNGIDTKFFKPSKKSFKNKGKTIGFIGRHSKEKRLEDLIGIAGDFDGQILIAGKGPATDYYKKMAKRYKNVKFLGVLPRGKVPEFYSSLDALVLPSIAETQSLVVLEANACGIPAIGANALALKDTVEEGVNGCLYEPGNLEELLSKVEMTLKKSWSKSCREYAEMHSIEKTISKLVSMYEGLERKE